jgi:hypothetical protein
LDESRDQFERRFSRATEAKLGGTGSGNPVAPVWSTVDFEEIFGEKVSLGKRSLGLNFHRVSSLCASGLEFFKVSSDP